MPLCFPFFFFMLRSFIELWTSSVFLLFPPFLLACCANTFIFPWTLDAIVLISHAPLLLRISHLFLPRSLSSISFLAVLS